jgi:hypothetical protein
VLVPYIDDFLFVGLRYDQHDDDADQAEENAHPPAEGHAALLLADNDAGGYARRPDDDENHNSSSGIEPCWLATVACRIQAAMANSEPLTS